MNSHKTAGDNIKKDLQKLESEIKKWFENKGYLAIVLVLGGEIVINIGGKMCDDDVLRFNNDFDCNLQYQIITGEDLKNKGGKRLAHVDYEDFKIEKYSFTPIFIKKIL